MLAPGQFHQIARGYLMRAMKTVEEVRLDRLAWVMRERGYNIQALADAIQRSHSQVSQLLSRAKHSTTGRPRTIGRDLARDMEAKLGLPVGILDTPIADSVGKVTEPEQQYRVAQPLSQAGLTVTRKPLSWRELMRLEDLPVVFEALLPDDAMGPELPAGMKVEFDTRETPVFGDKILVRDAKGDLHLRLYKQAPGGGWEAPATNRAFLDMLPERDGLTIMAVMTGHFVPRRRPN